MKFANSTSSFISSPITSRRARLRERVYQEALERRAADLTRANRDLGQKNQEIEMFVYSVSHDLRSPLVNLQGFSSELGLAREELQKLLARRAHRRGPAACAHPRRNAK